MWDLAVANTDVQPWEERGSKAGLGEAGQAGTEDQLCGQTLDV